VGVNIELPEVPKSMKANKAFGRKVLTGAAIVFGVLLLFSSFTTVENGHVGLRKTMGKVDSNVLEPGFHFKIPFIQQIIEINVQVQKSEADTQASSSDLQVVQSKIAVNYMINKDSAYKLYRDVGLDFEAKIIEPHLKDIFKSVTAKYTPNALISKRELVAKEANELLYEDLLKYYIVVKDISIVNFDFSEAFNNSIEQKQVAEQDAMKAENELKKAKIDAQQKVVQAQAEADATKTRADAELYATLQRAKGNNQLAKSMNANVVNYEFVKAWDGKMPTTWGNGNLVNVLPAK
jgi:regulator of protease activity HflC (stomatin/prohibitin superfamily)